MVSAATGEPIAGAKVHCRELPTVWLHGMSYEAEADENGRFTFRDVAPSEYEVSARASGAYGATVGVRLHPGENARCEVRTDPALDIRGQVAFREKGAPAAGLGVRAKLSEPPSWTPSWSVVNARTGEDGRFVLHGLPPATYGVSAGGLRPVKVDLTSGETPDELFLELEGAGLVGVVSGTVRYANGQPVPGSWVAIGGDPPLLTATDHEGRYELRLLSLASAAGARMGILAMAPDMSLGGTVSLPADWQPGQSVDVPLDRALGSATARVVGVEGRPIPGAVVWARRHWEAGDENLLCGIGASAVADEDGLFLLAPIDPECRYALIAEKPGHVMADEHSSVIEPGRRPPDIALLQTDGRLAGRVLDEQGRPLGDIVMTCWAGESFARALSDTEGRFELLGLVSGEECRVYACGIDYGPVHLRGLSVTEESLEIRFPGPAANVLTCTALDGDGRPVRSYGVFNGDYTEFSMPLDHLGRLHYTRCATRDYSVEVPSADRSLWVRLWEVPAGAEDLVLRFPTEEQLAVRREERGARASRHHPTGERISLAEHAYLTNSANVGPLPVKDGYWMMQVTKHATVPIQVPETGRYAVTVRARRVSKDVPAVLNVRAGARRFTLQLEDYEWREYTHEVEIEEGESRLAFQLLAGRQTRSQVLAGWAADIDWAEVRRVE